MRTEDIRLARARRYLSEFEARPDEPVAIRDLRGGLSQLVGVADSPSSEDSLKTARRLFLAYARKVGDHTKQ